MPVLSRIIDTSRPMVKHPGQDYKGGDRSIHECLAYSMRLQIRKNTYEVESRSKYGEMKYTPRIPRYSECLATRVHRDDKLLD